MRNLYLIILFLIKSIVCANAQNSCILICHDKTVYLNENGTTLLTPEMLAESFMCNNDSIKITVLSTSGNEILPYASSHLLSCDNLFRLGQFKVRVAEINKGKIGTSCNLALTVRDPNKSCVYPSPACVASGMICNQDVTVSLDANGTYLLNGETGGVNIHPDCANFMKVQLSSWDTIEVLPLKPTHLLNCNHIGKFQVANIIYTDSIRYKACWYNLTIVDNTAFCPPVTNCNLTCNDQLTISIDATGFAKINAKDVLIGNGHLPCEDDLRLKILDLNIKEVLPNSPYHSFQCNTIGQYKAVASVIHNGIEKSNCITNLIVNDANGFCQTNGPCILLCEDRTIDLDEFGKIKLNWQSFGLQAACKIDSLQVSLFDENDVEILPYNTSHLLTCKDLGNYKVKLAEILNGNIGTHCMSKITIADPKKACSNCMFTFCDFDLDIFLDADGKKTINWDVALLPNSYTGACEDLFQIRVYTHEGDVLPYNRSHDLNCGMVGDYYLGTALYNNGVYEKDCFSRIHIKDTTNSCSVNNESYAVKIESKFIGPYIDKVQLNGIPLNKIHYALFELPKQSVLPSDNKITFTGKKRKLNGVNTMDLVMIYKFLLEETVPSPLQSILSDYDRSGYIGLNDALQMRKAILGIDMLQNEYIFLKKDLTFPSNFNPFDFGKEVYDFDFLGTQAQNTNFIFNAYLSGDVDLSATFTSEVNSENRSTSYLSYKDAYMKAGHAYTVDFRFDNKDAMIGMQAQLQFSKATVLGIDSKFTTEEFLTQADNNSIKLSFLSLSNQTDVQFSVTIMAQEDGFLSDQISLNKALQAMYVTTALMPTDFKLQAQISSSTNELKISKIKAWPNPSNGHAEIIVSGIENQVNIQSYNGKLIHSFFNKGDHITLNPNMFIHKGLYFIWIKNEQGNYFTKLIIE